jgi:hypothetical protein
MQRHSPASAPLAAAAPVIASAAGNPAAPRQRLQHNTSLTLGALLTLMLKNGQLQGNQSPVPVVT